MIPTRALGNASILWIARYCPRCCKGWFILLYPFSLTGVFPSPFRRIPANFRVSAGLRLLEIFPDFAVVRVLFQHLTEELDGSSFVPQTQVGESHPR